MRKPPETNAACQVGHFHTSRAMKKESIVVATIVPVTEMP